MIHGIQAIWVAPRKLNGTWFFSRALDLPMSSHLFNRSVCVLWPKQSALHGSLQTTPGNADCAFLGRPGLVSTHPPGLYLSALLNDVSTLSGPSSFLGFWTAHQRSGADFRNGLPGIHNGFSPVVHVLISSGPAIHHVAPLASVALPGPYWVLACCLLGLWVALFSTFF